MQKQKKNKNRSNEENPQEVIQKPDKKKNLELQACFAPTVRFDLDTDKSTDDELYASLRALFDGLKQCSKFVPVDNRGLYLHEVEISYFQDELNRRSTARNKQTKYLSNLEREQENIFTDEDMFPSVNFDNREYVELHELFLQSNKNNKKR